MRARPRTRSTTICPTYGLLAIGPSRAICNWQRTWLSLCSCSTTGTEARKPVIGTSRSWLGRAPTSSIRRPFSLQAPPDTLSTLDAPKQAPPPSPHHPCDPHPPRSTPPHHSPPL